METAHEFPTMGTMVQYVCGYWNGVYKGNGNPGLFVPLEPTDIVLQYMYSDKRIGWHDSMHVCLCRNPYMQECYRYPQCVGTCATDYDKPVRSEDE